MTFATAVCRIAAALTFTLPAFAQPVLLSQPPNRVDAVLSDAKLQSLPFVPDPTGACVADNFVLSSDATIGQARIWGIYFPGGVAPALDRFAVVLHADAAGLPGAVLATQHHVPATRQVTGASVTGVAEHVYTLTLNPVLRTPGTYWIEICNDTTGNPSAFYWEFGTTDVQHGIPGAASLLTATPGSNWRALAVDVDRQDLAIEIAAEPAAAAVPALTGGGMAVVTLAIAASGLLLAARRRAA